MTLTEFLLARIAEDEAGATSNEYEVAAHTARCGYDQLEFGYDCTCHWTSRILAECEAKRRIVKLHRGFRDEHPGTTALHYLAVAYADHPDYDEAWRP